MSTSVTLIVADYVAPLFLPSASDVNWLLIGSPIVLLTLLGNCVTELTKPAPIADITFEVLLKPALSWLVRSAMNLAQVWLSSVRKASTC
jgi:hypothetical protein